MINVDSVVLRRKPSYPLSQWHNDYNNKKVTAEEAAKIIQSGDRLFMGGGTGIPASFATALGKRAGTVNNVTIYQGYAMGLYDYMKPENKESFHIETMFVGPMERVCMEWKMAHYKPMHLSDIPEAGLDARCNKVAFTATPPDEDGFMNLSCFGAFLPKKEVLCKADTIIAEINTNTPWLNSVDFLVHVSEVDYIIEHDTQLFELPEIPITDVEKKMAEMIADLIPDGATIQLGLGGLANGIGNLLYTKKDLGMHAEVITPSVMRLIEAGVINGINKTLYPEKVVGAFAVGTKEFYQYLDHNNNFLFCDIGWVNTPDVIALNDNFVSINNALILDLTGQVAAESIGTKQYSGTGGQVDFIRGAKKSKGGKSIIALSSTYTDKQGKIHSNIVPLLPLGTVVTTSRTDVEYVVTEYGVANLRMRSIYDRVHALISIAHPDFRDELKYEAAKIGWI